MKGGSCCEKSSRGNSNTPEGSKLVLFTITNVTNSNPTSLRNICQIQQYAWFLNSIRYQQTDSFLWYLTMLWVYVDSKMIMSGEQVRTETVVAYMEILHWYSFEETSVSIAGRPGEIQNRYFFTYLIYFWDITPCILLKVNWRFKGTYHLHLQGRVSRAKYQLKIRWQFLITNLEV
jgi:hypothetical protein